MAAWTEAQKDSIREYMGASVLFKLNFYPLLESTMTTVLAQADGGSQPDDTTQQRIIVILGYLADVDDRLNKLSKRFQVDTAETATVKFHGDFARAMYAARTHGRMWASRLAKKLGFKAVLLDVFSAEAPRVPPPIGPDLYSQYGIGPLT